MVDVSVDMEKYNGFWDQRGIHTLDPSGSDLRQYRLNLGYARRLASRWQASIAAPYIWNVNKYQAGPPSRTEGIGDTTLSLWYETFDRVRSVFKVRAPDDLMPSITLGASLTVPTGTSPYDDVKSSFDVTGRGFYRLDGNVLVDKTIYPWSGSLLLNYGTYLERPVNREYDKYVKPYHQKLGDRTFGTFALSYISFLFSPDLLTFTGSFSYLHEAEGTINGERNSLSGFRKESFAGTIAYSTMKPDWTYRFTWSHAVREDGWGQNFPTTDIYSIGVSYGWR
jgi:hypothetical protein